jgi:RNA polymerase sigma factor (sigma-70 family)
MAKAPETRPSLLVRVRDPGDGPAWVQFVDIYAPLIYGHARKKGLQDADAADVTQEVLRAVAPAIRQLDYDPGRGSFRGWLFTIVRNELRSFMSRQERQARGRGDTEAIAILQAQAQPVSDEEAAWSADYERRLFSWAAEQIRPTFAEATWQAFWRTAVEGQNPKEVAKALAMTLTSVYTAKSRVLARLKELIQQVRGEEDHE